MSQTGNLLDSTEVAQTLNVSQTNLRQLVFRKQLTPVGRKSRRSLFEYDQVMLLATQRKSDIPVI